jgi:hypothetical protein
MEADESKNQKPETRNPEPEPTKNSSQKLQKNVTEIKNYTFGTRG